MTETLETGKRYLNSSNEIFLESSIFNLEQVLLSDFTLRFETLL